MKGMMQKRGRQDWFRSLPLIASIGHISIIFLFSILFRGSPPP